MAFPDCFRFKSVADFAARARACGNGRRAWAAFAFGAFASLAFAPLNIVPVLWLSFPALIFLLQGAPNLCQAFIAGWCFAFGLFAFSFYWIAASMFVDIASFWWAVPLALAGLPAFFAIYYGLAMMAAHKIGLGGARGPVFFALLWFLAEYARGHVFGGFPWGLTGYSWGRVLPVMQLSSILGVYGLTLLTLLAASLPALLAQKNTEDARRIVAGSLLFLLAIGLWGEARLLNASSAMVPDVRLRLVQPNTDQAHKWLESEREGNFRQLLNYSSAPALQRVTHVIWPETASTYYLTEDVGHRVMVAAALPDALLLTGVVRRFPDGYNELHYFNSLVAVDHHARIVAGYDKAHLVPFGEFIPLRHYLPIKTLVNGLDFSAGPGARSLRVAGLPPFSPLICYEAIFSGDVADHNDRPSFLLNVTNDGWYGRTAGPYQHFSIARMRAIEEGMPLVRAANTGISGVVDAYGRVVTRLGVAKTGFIDSDLPQALPPTFFSRYHETALWVLFAVLAVGAGMAEIRQKQRRK